MPKLKNYAKGKRISAWIPSRNRKIFDEIENKSAFIQLALDNAIDIMAWDILKRADPEKYHINRAKPDEQIIEEFNVLNPLDPLTAKRKGKSWHKNSAKKQELW